MIKLPDESAFEKWFKAVEAGDDAEWTEPKYLSSEWNEYLHRRQLALGAWQEFQAEVQRLNATAQPISDGCKVPERWKLVPVEPTWEMLSADGCTRHHDGQDCMHHKNRKRIWQAMLAAAPDNFGENGPI